MAEHYYGVHPQRYRTKDASLALVLQGFDPGVTASEAVLITPWRPHRLHETETNQEARIRCLQGQFAIILICLHWANDCWQLK